MKEVSSILDIILENSKALEKEILEGTTQDDISKTDVILGDIIRENYAQSLMYQITEINPLKAPQGSIYTSRRNAETNKFEVIRTDVQTKTNTIITGFTQEVFQDMQKMFKISAKNAMGKVLAGITAREENSTILRLLESESITVPSLPMYDTNNLESTILQLSKKVSESVIQMNQDTYKTLDSFCILPHSFAAAYLGSFSYMSEGKEKNLFVGRVGRTDYYINPFPNTSSEFDQSFDYSYEIEDTPIPNYCYVGLLNKTPGTSSIIFTPYLYERDYIIDPDTGENVVVLRNRYGVIPSPQHEPLKNRSLLHKFQITKI